MKDKNLFLILGLGIACGTILINRFIAVPDYIGIILMMASSLFMIIYIIKNRRQNRR